VMLDLSPADDYAHYALGRCLEKRGRDAEANGHYKLARSLRPDSRHYAARVRDLDPPQVPQTP
jgi:Flp pilus assembly protein TadD